MKESLSHLATKVSMREPSLDVNEVGLMAEGDVFTEETSDMREAVVEGFTQEDLQEDVLHGVLYS